MAAKAAKFWSLPKFWVSIRSYKKQPVKNGQNIGPCLAQIRRGGPAEDPHLFNTLIKNHDVKMYVHLQTQFICKKRKYNIHLKIPLNLITSSASFYTPNASNQNQYNCNNACND